MDPSYEQDGICGRYIEGRAIVLRNIQQDDRELLCMLQGLSVLMYRNLRGLRTCLLSERSQLLRMARFEDMF